jgi:hypothetical protein
MPELWIAYFAEKENKVFRGQFIKKWSIIVSHARNNNEKHKFILAVWSSGIAYTSGTEFANSALETYRKKLGRFKDVENIFFSNETASEFKSLKKFYRRHR